MQPTLPTIEDLHDRLARATSYSSNDPMALYLFYQTIAQTMLLIALELEQINNNLEALRPEDNISKKEWEAFKADLRSRGM